jgi:GNAT superfamily N-acetyltransferase
MSPPAPTAVVAGSARPEEIEEVRRLRAEGGDALGQWRGGAAVRAELGELPGPDDGDAALLVGRIGEVVVGYAVLRRGSDRADLRELYCEPPARGVGVGHALLEAAMATASGWGCAAIDSQALPGDRATKNFFEAHGMVSRLIVVSRSLEEGT